MMLLFGKIHSCMYPEIDLGGGGGLKLGHRVPMLLECVKLPDNRMNA